jgi:hypothetical protein
MASGERCRGWRISLAEPHAICWTRDMLDLELLDAKRKDAGGLSDHDEKAAESADKLLFSKHEGPIDGFGVWDSARVVCKHRPDLQNGAENADDSCGS